MLRPDTPRTGMAKYRELEPMEQKLSVFRVERYLGQDTSSTTSMSTPSSSKKVPHYHDFLVTARAYYSQDRVYEALRLLHDMLDLTIMDLRSKAMKCSQYWILRAELENSIGNKKNVIDCLRQGKANECQPSSAIDREVQSYITKWRADEAKSNIPPPQTPLSKKLSRSLIPEKQENVHPVTPNRKNPAYPQSSAYTPIADRIRTQLTQDAANQAEAATGPSPTPTPIADKLRERLRLASEQPESLKNSTTLQDSRPGFLSPSVPSDKPKYNLAASVGGNSNRDTDPTSDLAEQFRKLDLNPGSQNNNTDFELASNIFKELKFDVTERPVVVKEEHKEPEHGSVIVKEQVRLKPRLADELGSPRAITNVRRSRRGTGSRIKPSVSFMLEESNFAYTPNPAIIVDSAASGTKTPTKNAATPSRTPLDKKSYRRTPASKDRKSKENSNNQKQLSSPIDKELGSSVKLAPVTGTPIRRSRRLRTPKE